MKKTMKKTAAALCIAATLVSVAAPAMAVSPAEYMSTAALEECNTATVAQVESLINQIGTVTTARRPAIVAAVNAYNELDDASKAQVSNFAVLAEAQQVLGLKDALAKLKISYDKVEDARSYVSPTEDRLSNQGKSYILPFFVNGSTNDPSIMAAPMIRQCFSWFCVAATNMCTWTRLRFARASINIPTRLIGRMWIVAMMESSTGN